MIAFLLAMLPPTSDRRAVTALEYGLIAGVIVAAVLAGFSAFGDALSVRFDSVASDIT